MKQILFSTLFLIVYVCAYTQAPATLEANPKMDAIITALEATEFIKQYKDYQDITEGIVNDIKIKTGVTPAELAKAQFTYRQSATEFNGIIEMLKRDLSNSTTRKMIVKSPDLYTSSYQIKLNAAKVNCQNKFYVSATKILQRPGSSQTEQLEMLIKTLFAVVKMFAESNAVNEAANAAYLDAKFMQPLRYKTWEKIE